MSFSWTKLEVLSLEAQTLINKILWVADEATDANKDTIVSVTKDTEELLSIVTEMQKTLRSATEDML